MKTYNSKKGPDMVRAFCLGGMPEVQICKAKGKDGHGKGSQ